MPRVSPKKKSKRSARVAETEKISGHWTAQEHNLYVQLTYGELLDDRMLANRIGTRTEGQVKSHGQKHDERVLKAFVKGAAAYAAAEAKVASFGQQRFPSYDEVKNRVGHVKPFRTKYHKWLKQATFSRKASPTGDTIGIPTTESLAKEPEGEASPVSVSQASSIVHGDETTCQDNDVDLNPTDASLLVIQPTAPELLVQQINLNSADHHNDADTGGPRQVALGTHDGFVNETSSHLLINIYQDHSAGKTTTPHGSIIQDLDASSSIGSPCHFDVVQDFNTPNYTYQEDLDECSLTGLSNPFDDFYDFFKDDDEPSEFAP